LEDKKVRKVVREGYAKIAKQDSSCCAPKKSCCGSTDVAQDISKNIGYTYEDLKVVPDGANLGLGCGNPIALAGLKEGETVLDLGSGAGLDCFLAAKKVGKNGKVIGIDMTSEMIEKARENATKGDFKNVEFRLGEIENLPVADNSVDIIVSNCVINLSPDKQRVFNEAFRVLKPGGRLMVSDIVLLKELPDIIKNSVEAYIGCLSGAIKKDEYLKLIRKAGFQQVDVTDETFFPVEFMANEPTAKAIINKQNIGSEKIKEAAGSVISIKVRGDKTI
jgi:ubiquinone/menaquinone biosynthesis C-methylase UbiE